MPPAAPPQPVREAGVVGRAVARIQLDDAVRNRELSLPRDAPSSARHEGVPVLMTDLEPDTLLFTFAQRWP